MASIQAHPAGLGVEIQIDNLKLENASIGLPGTEELEHVLSDYLKGTPFIESPPDALAAHAAGPAAHTAAAPDDLWKLTAEDCSAFPKECKGECIVYGERVKVSADEAQIKGIANSIVAYIGSIKIGAVFHVDVDALAKRAKDEHSRTVINTLKNTITTPQGQVPLNRWVVKALSDVSLDVQIQVTTGWPLEYYLPGAIPAEIQKPPLNFKIKPEGDVERFAWTREELAPLGVPADRKVDPKFLGLLTLLSVFVAYGADVTSKVNGPKDCTELLPRNNFVRLAQHAGAFEELKHFDNKYNTFLKLITYKLAAVKNDTRFVHKAAGKFDWNGRGEGVTVKDWLDGLMQSPPYDLLSLEDAKPGVGDGSFGKLPFREVLFGDKAGTPQPIFEFRGMGCKLKDLATHLTTVMKAFATIHLPPPSAVNGIDGPDAPAQQPPKKAPVEDKEPALHTGPPPPPPPPPAGGPPPPSGGAKSPAKGAGGGSTSRNVKTSKI